MDFKAALAFAAPVLAILLGIWTRPRAGRLGASDPRLYQVFFTEPLHPNQLISARVVADKKLSKAELKAIIVERGSGSMDLTITKVRSEALD